MSDDPLGDALNEVARPLRGLSGLWRLMAGAASALVVLAIAAWLIRSEVAGGPTWILAAWIIAISLLATGLVLARRAIGSLGPWRIADHLEAIGAWRRGALTTVLDPPAAGTSATLHAAAAQAHATDVEARAAEALRPAVDTQARRARLAGGIAAGGLLALAATGPLHGTTALLWDPLGAWHALTAPVRLAARTASVARGESAILDIAAAGQRHATLLTRTPGEAWQRRDVRLDASGQATITTSPLSAELVARLEAGGRTSDEIRVAVRLPAFLGALTLQAHYPAYLAMDAEALPTGGDTVLVPEGTRLVVSGQVTAPLASAVWTGRGTSHSLTVAGVRFVGEVIPAGSGVWQLQLTLVDGGALEGDVPGIPVVVVADSTPVVDIPVPGADTVAPPSLGLALVVSARDDHALRALTLEVRRGATGAITRVPLAIDESDRALVTTVLDLAIFGAKPGDTVHYVAVATDNAPAVHVGRSRDFLVRIPTEREQRIARADATMEASAGFDSVAASVRRAQRQAEDLARERQRALGKGTGDGDRQPLSLEAARKAEVAALTQEKVLAQSRQLAQEVEKLRQAAMREGLADTALARQLGDIQRLLEQALTPELRAQLAALRDAVKELDADRTRTALQDLVKKQAELKDALEQARELFKRAAVETELANLALEAKQLTTEQRQTTAQLARSDNGRSSAAEERALAARADSLASALDRASQKVPSAATTQGLRQAGARARQASQQMQHAAQSAQLGQSQDAATAGKEAESTLDPLAAQIRDERQRMQQEMRQEVLDALVRTLAETSRLAQRQVMLASAFRRGVLVSQSRIDQGTVEEGAGKLMQQVTLLSAKNALVSPRAGVALAAARQSMRAAVEAVSSASPNTPEAADQAGDAVDALTVAAFNLLRDKDKVGGSQSGSGLQEAMEQMQQLAGMQGKLSEQANGMLSQGQGGVQQMLQMAMQQRAIAQQMERMRGAGQVPGAGALAREAKDLSRTLEVGRLTPETAARQERLFKKMLDAGRSLQGEEQDETRERQSFAARSAALGTPAAIDPRLRRNDFRLPGWDQLQGLTPEERHRVMDYFRRLAGGGL